MGTQYLLDSNVIIDFLDNRLPDTGMSFVSNIVDNEPNISVISKIEILRFNAPIEKYRILVGFISYSDVYPLEDNVVNKTIEICRQYKIKLPDAIIAATAIINNFTLITHNTKDFQKIRELQMLDSHDIN